jgi:hypothetical protein
MGVLYFWFYTTCARYCYFNVEKCGKLHRIEYVLHLSIQKFCLKLLTFVEIETLYIFVTIYSIDPQNLGAIPYSA